jgi:hypothetical protein
MADLATISVGQTGKVWNAPVGTTVPATAATALAAGYVDLGTISEDGLAVEFNEDSTDIKAWGGTTVRKLMTSFDLTFAFTCLESNAEVLARFYRQTVEDGKVLIKGGVRDPRVWIFDVLDSDTHFRYVVPNGELTERGGLTHKSDEAIRYAFTVSAYPDSNGVAATEYSDLAAWAGA